MEIFGLSEVLSAAGEVGVVIFTMAVGAYFLVALVRLTKGLFDSSNERWDDIIKILQAQLTVQREYNVNLNNFKTDMHSEFEEVRTDVNLKINRLEGKVDKLASDVQQILLLIGEEKANG